MSSLIRSGSGAEWPPKQSEETSSMKKALQLLRIGVSFFGCDLHKQASYYSQWMWHHVTVSLAYFSLPLSWLLIEFKCFFTLSTVLAFRKSASCFKCWRDKQGILTTVDCMHSDFYICKAYKWELVIWILLSPVVLHIVSSLHAWEPRAPQTSAELE